MVDIDPTVGNDSGKAGDVESHVASCNCGDEVWGPIPKHLKEEPAASSLETEKATNIASREIPSAQNMVASVTGVAGIESQENLLVSDQTSLNETARSNFIFASASDTDHPTKTAQQLFADRILRQYGISNIYSPGQLREALRRRKEVDQSFEV